MRCSAGLPSRSVTRAVCTPKREERASSKRTSSPFSASPVLPARHRPFFQLLAVDRIDHAGAAGKRAENAEQAPRGARQPLDGPRLIGIAGIGAKRGDAGEHAVADAGDGARLALALGHEDAGRGPMLLVPGRGPGHEFAVAVAARRSRSRSPAAARQAVSSLRREPAIRPSSAISRNSAFSAMRSPPLTPKARAISRLPASPVAVARKSRISCFEGSLPAVLLRGAASAP